MVGTLDNSAGYPDTVSQEPTEATQAILNRYRRHIPTDEDRWLIGDANRYVLRLAGWIAENVPDGRNRALALTYLEEAHMRINKAIVAGG